MNKILTITAFTIALIIPLAITALTFLITRPSFAFHRDTPSPFECGFTPIIHARLPFSLRFFLLAVLFLIFDIEIIIIFPIIPSIMKVPMLYIGPPLLMFLFILCVGLAHEWNEKSLQWA